MNLKEEFSKFRLVKEDEKYIYVKGTRGVPKIVKISKVLTHDMYFLAGVILGDGHLKKDKTRISIELTDKEKLQSINKMFELTFGLQSIRIHPIRDKRENRKLRFLSYIDSAPIYHLFHEIFQIPRGKKSHKIFVPKFVFNAPLTIKKYFLLGVFITDGGKRSGINSKGLSTASLEFRDGISRLLRDVLIIDKHDQWLNKKYRKVYYGLYFHKKYIKNMRGFQSGQMDQILEYLTDKLEGQA
ncbi:MAG: LAGLIDADG family homing endonuclease [Nanoarchaeota archaeon]